jgi:predicted nucleic acid-binding protein
MVRICIDSEFALNYLLGKEIAVKKLQFYLYEELAVSAFTAFQLLSAITDKDVVNNFLSQLNVLPFDHRTAKIAAHLLNQQPNTPLDVVIIAATTIAYDTYLLTTRRRVFEKMRGVRFI